jgi:nicotinate-nucleotide pyrophosphorylase (carboxylating)
VNTVDLVRAALEEDTFSSDITTEQVSLFLGLKGVDPDFKLGFVIAAKGEGVYSGSAWVDAMAEVTGLELQSRFKEGQGFLKGDMVVHGRGRWSTILSAERTLLNELQMLCGIATQTRNCVETIQKTWAKMGGHPGEEPHLLHTRKTLPLHRTLMVAAVKAGGGYEHRVNLKTRVLVKENHKYVAQKKVLKFDDLVKFLGAVKGLAEVEVESVEEMKAALDSGAKALLLDNFSPTALKLALPQIPLGVEIEVSGGITRENLADFVMPQVTRISMGSLTHTIKPIDLSLDWV